MTSERGIDSEDQTTPDNLVDTDEIRCVCGISDDDGYTIQCDNCYTWQHIECMKADPKVKEYKCHSCSDVKIEKSLKDSKRSKRHQKVRRETESGAYPSALQIGESSTTIIPNKSRNRSSDLPSAARERQPSSHSKDYEQIEKNIIASKAVEELFPKIYSQYQHRKRSMSLSSTSKTDNEHNRDDSQESSSIRSTSPSLEIGNPFNMEKESLARPFMKTIVKQVNLSRPKMLKKHFNCYGLFAETNISKGYFIVEFKGEVCLKSDYKSNESNQYSLLGVTQPFVLFYPVLNLCVDARRVGTEARFIRRSCHPNAETRTIVVPGGDEVHLGIFSKCEISKGKEITIGWDWESNHVANSLMHDSIFENEDENTLAKKRDEIGKIAAAILRLTECACENKDDCTIYKMQNEGKILNKSRKKKLALDEGILIEGEKETSPGANDEDYEDDMDLLATSQKKRDNVSLTRKINRKGKQNAERLNESSLNGNNKSLPEENEVPSRKDKKKAKEIDTKSDNHAQYGQRNKGKESINRIREEPSGSIKRKSLNSRKTEKSVNKHARSSLISKIDGSKRRSQHDEDDEQHSDSSLSSLRTNSEMSIDDDFSNTSIIEVTPPDHNNADKNNPNEQISKESNEDQLSVLYGPSDKIDHPIGINDISQSTTNPPRPLPPAISRIPFKDYLIQMHEWKKAIETVPASASTENDNPTSSILRESNIDMTSEYIEAEKSKGSKNKIDKDQVMDKDEEIIHDEGLVPLPTPIIPAKRMASSPNPTLNNPNGKNLYSENGSDVKGKRQKTEELQNYSIGKGKELEIEKEGAKILQNNNVQSLISDNRSNVGNAEDTISIKSSGDLKKQATGSLTSCNSSNEISKTTFKKLSLDEYRSQQALEKKPIEGSKSPILSVSENDKTDNKTIDNNDAPSTKESSTSISTINNTKTKLSMKEYQDKKLAESSNNNNMDVLKKYTDPIVTEEFKQKSDVIENKQINELKSEEVSNLTVSSSPKSPKQPKTSTIEDNNTASQSSLINDGYFPEVDLPFDFSAPLDTSKDLDSFSTNEYGRHANSSHSDGSYEETRGRHSPSYKDYSSIKSSSSNYNSSYNMPLSDTSMQTSPRPEHMSPPRGHRYYGGHFRGNRMGGSYRGISISPGDRSRYHGGSGYFNSTGSLPATPRQGTQSSIITSSASSPYDPANPDGQSTNTSNEREPVLDNSNVVGNNSGSGIAMESKARDYARSGGDRSDLRDRWGYSNNYFNMDRSREREWRERERDDGRKDWNSKRMDHYREREYTGTSELPRYPMMATRRPSSGPHQDRYTIIGTVPTGPAGLNSSPSGISKNNEQSSSSNNPSQRFGIDSDHRSRRR